MPFIKSHRFNQVISKYMKQKCGSSIKICCRFCSTRRFWKNLVFRIFIKKGPWREWEGAGENRQVKLDSGLMPDNFSQCHGRLWSWNGISELFLLNCTLHSHLDQPLAVSHHLDHDLGRVALYSWGNSWKCSLSTREQRTLTVRYLISHLMVRNILLWLECIL